MKIFFILVCLTFFNCQSSKEFFLNKSTGSLKTQINKSRNCTQKENERYINNEIKFLLESRKDFFSKMKLKDFDNIILIEIFNAFSSDSYTAIVNVGSKVHYFKSNIKYETTYEQIDYTIFIKEYKMLACLMLKSENNIEVLIGPKNDSTFHFTVYITKKEL